MDPITPTGATNNDIYASSDYHAQRHGVSEAAFKLIARYRASKFLAFSGPDAEILEFGCGPGWNLTDIRAKRKVGFDVTAEYAEQIRQNGIEFTTDLSSLAGQRFDLILMSHVMEHLVEPARLIAELQSFLKPDGVLLLIVPFDKPGTTYDPKHNNHHLYMWDVQSLTELLMACGYSVKSCKIYKYGFDRLAAKLAVRLGFGSSYRSYRMLMGLLRMIRPGYEIRATLTVADRGPNPIRH